MIFRELSNAVFCFVLRWSGAEIDGGVQTPPPPPPQQVVENLEAHQGAGYYENKHKIKNKYQIQ